MKLSIWPLLAAILDPWRPNRSGMVQVLTILVVILVLSLLVFIWAAFFRKPHRRHRHLHHRYPPGPSRADTPNPPAPNADPVPRRRHFRRREHRPRNPTLAEAGGLPPTRADDPGPPPPAV